ncbi:MAG: hypothetical protein KDD47_03545 [Acidobacteria bacterium]|nr:hypothetical protein [Acidobacteriota bacterium]
MFEAPPSTVAHFARVERKGFVSMISGTTDSMVMGTMCMCCMCRKPMRGGKLEL